MLLCSFSRLISQIDAKVSRPVVLLVNELLAGWSHPLLGGATLFTEPRSLV